MRALGVGGLVTLVVGSARGGAHAHPVYAGGEDNGVRIMSHANTDFHSVDGAPAGGKVRTYQDFEAHGDFEAKGALTHQGKPVATIDDVAAAKSTATIAASAAAASAADSVAASVRELANATRDGIARLNASMDNAEGNITVLRTNVSSELSNIKAELNIALSALADLSPPECDWRFTARQEFIRGKWRCVCGFSGRTIPGSSYSRFPMKVFNEDLYSDFQGIDCSEQRGPLAAFPSSTMPTDVTHRIPLRDGRMFAFSNWETNGRNPALYEFDPNTLEVMQLDTYGRTGFHEATTTLDRWTEAGPCGGSRTRNQLYLSSPVSLGSTIYFVGGQKLHAYNVDEPGLGLMDLGNLPDIRNSPAVAFFGTKLFVAGGFKRSYSYNHGASSIATCAKWLETWTSIPTVMVYDTAAETASWKQLTSKLTLDKGLSRMAWCSDETRLYLFGGRREKWTSSNSGAGITHPYDHDVSKLNSAMMVDSEDETVTALPDMPEGHEWVYPQTTILQASGSSSCAILRDTVYVAGGVIGQLVHGTATGTILSFNLTARQWATEQGSAGLAELIPWAGPISESKGKASFASLLTLDNRLWVTAPDGTGGVMFEPGWAPGPGAS